jgi:hypothetical protein
MAEAANIDAAITSIMEAYRTAPLVIVEEPMAWPVVLRSSYRKD